LPRRRPRNSRGGTRAVVRAVRRGQGRWHRPWPRDCAARSGRASRRDSGRQRPRRGDDIFHLLARHLGRGGREMSQQQPSVLVIDDESGILDTLRILLKKEGFEVTVAQGGKAGLEAIRTATADIVLTDVRMPQVTGLDILQAVKDFDPMTPVILMTAQASLQSAIQAVNAGAFYYLQKPFANDELLAVLKRACEFRQIRVENKHLKQEIRRAAGTKGTSTVA